LTAALVTRWHDVPPPGWEALHDEDPNASPAGRAGLPLALAATTPGRAAAFLTVERDGALVGGAPFVLGRRAGLTWVHGLPWLLPGTPIARAGEHAVVDAALAGALAAFAAGHGVVGGEWVFHRPAGPAPDPDALASLPGETRRLPTALVDLSAGPEAAWRRLGRHARQELTAARRLGLAVREDPGAIESAWALHDAQARAWSGHRTPPLELLRRLLAAAPPLARLFTVGDRAGLLAAVVVLVHRHEWFAWWSGTRPEARRSHAFGLLLWEAAMRAAGEGAARFNVGASADREGVEGFKRSLGAQVTPAVVRWLAPRGGGPWGRAVAALQSRVRRGRARGEPA